MKPLIISFSGGRTSAYMAHILISQFKGKRKIFIVFMNTGEEHERTLEFINECDKRMGWNIIWLEAVVNGENIGTTHRIVTYETASRKGEPFESVIAKYGIPNKGYPHCTRELKLQPMASWLRAHQIDDYDMAIGIRADETRRVSKSAEAKNIIYPLVDIGVMKDDVLAFWEDQAFDLGVEEREGNCKWCWKKSDKKHFANISINPEWYDFPRRMELLHAFSGNGSDKTRPRKFFRSDRSTDELFAQYELCKGNILPSSDDSGCSESCELFPTI